MFYCPHCKRPLRLVAGDKYWVHENDNKVRCLITSIPNYPSLLQKLCANQPSGDQAADPLC